MVDDLARTEDELLRVRAEVCFLTEIASHLIKAGGKRVPRLRDGVGRCPRSRRGQPRST